ncbi:voltage-gated chloride channel, putative [Cryptococcus gattii WM276]|uniref:Chloride channel protein n=1 Tax=Cryptococcus gattii serotype B (strain WM276 / ATCC MYA-4071) TaxID=367775 RepID=E6R7C5_CRYGW|nr:voltage-gated chloride channel, putative [Cryptococcus gattii WM276]ADV22608.1 voltage-gated chloride channel, putative [Cryptococcus gattii WM276]
MTSTDSDDPSAPHVISTSSIARTPRLNPVASSNVIGLDTGAPSPRVQTSRAPGGHAQTSSGTTSSTSGSVSSTIDQQSRRRGSSRVLSTPGAGYSATHPNVGLGLGPTPSRAGTGSTSTTINDAALSSPRRISTSRGLHVPPQTAAPPAGNLGLPTHEAYYSVSQPVSATTPRFRDKGVYVSGGSGGLQHHSSSIGDYPSGSYGATYQNQPSRDLAPTSAIGATVHSPFPSPKGSVLKKLQKKASNVGLGLGRPDNYDDEALGRYGDEDEMLEDNLGERANGTRVWYSSFATIDWIHDAIKESSRVRRVRHAASRSLRGRIANTWDRFQGWLVVTLIGIITALIAFLIIRAEMAFFDLKEGFCSTSWGTAKRFCCAPRHQSPGSDGGEYECSDWVEWGQLFKPKAKDGPFGGWVYGGPEFMAYATVALLLAVIASCMTVYLSSSDHHTTSKDSTFLTPPSKVTTAKQSTASSPTKRTASLPYGPHDERQPLLGAITNEPPTPLIESPPEPSRKVMFYAAGSGIPEIKTILSGFVIHGYLGGWTLITKSAGLALSVGSGLSLGKEGPLVHISSCVGNIVSRMFLKFECNEAKRREVLSAACAAGVAVAFGAPVGGVLFSLEEVSYYFPPKVMWRSFWCAAIAAITLKALNPFGNGSLVLFAVSYTKEYHYWEYIIFIVLGIFGGLYGAVFARLNIIWSKHVRNGTWLKRHPIFEVALVVLLTTVVSFSNPYTRMAGTELVASLFEECNSSSSSKLCVSQPHELPTVIWEVFMALVIKGCLTIITFGIKVPAGIFIPSLAVGACFGRIVGHMMEYIEFVHPDLSIFSVCKNTDCVVPGIYAMVGAAATLAGVTRTTVSLAVIMFELTSTLNYVVPVMLSVLIAKTVADGLERKGIYDLVIDLNQLPYLDSKHEYLWGSRRASSVADRSVPHLRADKPHTVRSLTGKLLELVRLGMEDTGFPVLAKEVTSAGGPGTNVGLGLDGGIGSGRERSCLRVVGFLGINELEHALSELADEPDAAINLTPDDATQARIRNSALSIFSFADSFVDNGWNPCDLSRYIDQAPITVQIHSPLELVQQLFVKLGVRQIIVVNSRGVFQGIITKKAWLSFLSELEEGAGQ